MKPILVNNQQEWLRLAPVLEKQGHTWGENCTPLQYNPFTSGKTYYSGGAIVISFGWGILSWRHFSENSGETQSVDEYLAQAKGIETNELQKVNDINVADLEPDYKALYEAKCKAIEEALNEISIKGQMARSIYRETKDEDMCYMEQGAERAYLKCFEILTSKL